MGARAATGFLLFAVGATQVATAAGCGSAEPGCGSRGAARVVAERVVYCVYPAGTVAAQGDVGCPRGYPFRLEVRGGIVCAPGSTLEEVLPPEVLARAGEGATSPDAGRDGGATDGDGGAGCRDPLELAWSPDGEALRSAASGVLGSMQESQLTTGCGPGGADDASRTPELVYRLTLPDGRWDLRVDSRVAPTLADQPVTLALRDTCGGGGELACAAAPSGDERRAVLVARDVQAGEHLLVVEARRGESVGLVVLATPARTSAESCAEAPTLSLAGEPATAREEVTVPVAGALEGVDASCGAGDAPEIVRRVELPAGTWHLVSTTRLEPTTTATAVYVRAACDDAATELACDAPSAGSELRGEVRLTHQHGPAERWIVVEAEADATVGLRVQRLAAVEPAVACATPAQLDLVGNPPHASASGVGDASGGGGLGGSCSPNSHTDPESVFALDVSPGRWDLVATTRLEATAAGNDTEVYLRADCEDATTEEACANGDTDPRAELVARGVAPGRHFLVVESDRGEAWALDVRLRAILAPGDACDPAGVADRCAIGTCEMGTCP